MEFDTEPATHILGHLTENISSASLVAFDVYDEGEHCYNSRLLLITPSTELDRDQAKDLIDVLQSAFELDGVESGGSCTYRFL
jgi:hypothetical protein